MKKFAIFGNPLEHSKSPLIHNFFSKQTKIKTSYKKILTNKKNFEKDLKNFFHKGGFGANITSPFKELAYKKVDKLTKRAKKSFSVNTVKKIKKNKILGHNTDGIGLILDLKRLNFIKKNMNILIIGSGGVVKGIIPEILKHQCRITIFSRNKKKTLKIIKKYSRKKLSTFNYFHNKKYDLIINATAFGLLDGYSNLFFEKIFHKKTFCYDISYGNTKSQFLKLAKKYKVLKYSNGLGMLIIQAAYSFKLWNQILPNIFLTFKNLKINDFIFNK